MVLAPEYGRHGSNLSLYRHNVELVATATLHRCDIECKKVACLASTLHVVCNSR